MKKFLTTLACFALLLSSLTGCTSASSQRDGSDIVVNLSSEPSKLNSVLATGSVDGNVLRHTMLGLVGLDENDEAEAGCAESWTVSEDGLVYTFNIREGMTWTNGEAVTAHDFTYALSLLFDARSGASYAMTWAPIFEGATEFFTVTGQGYSEEDVDAGVEKATDAQVTDAWQATGIKALDDYTLELTITAPYTYFESLLAFMNFYPVNQVAVEAAGSLDSYATEVENFVGNGPFVMTAWNHEDSIVLEKNETYFNADNIQLDSITFKMISDSNTWLNEFNAGTLDMTNISGEQYQSLVEQGVTTYNYNDGSAWYLEFNTAVEGLSNAKVREAITLGLNAAKYVELTEKNASVVATSFTPPAILNGEFQEEVGVLMDRPEDDYSELKALLEEGLAEEGLTLDTFSFTLMADEGDTTKIRCEYIQEALNSNLGLTVNVEQITYQTRLSRMTAKDYDVVLAGWGPDYNDPMTFMDLWVTGGGNNHTNWSNERYDELISLAYVEGDADTRTAYLIEAEEILATEYPIGMTHWRSKDYLLADDLKGVVRTAFQDMDFTGAYIEAE